jgi:hypothetical protein
MKLNEIPEAVGRFAEEKLEALGKFTEKKLREREARLSDPRLQASLETMKDLIGDDVKRACGNGFTAACRLSLGAPLSSLWEATKELGSVVGHNFSEKDPKKKRSYAEVPAAAIKELFVQYGKGGVDAAKFAGNLSLALTRATVLGGRYLVGK